MEEMSYYVNILNIFMKHVNMYREKTTHMFDNVKTDDDTNDIMEEFYEHINQFKESDENIRRIYAYDEINVEDFEQLFVLKVDDKIICACELLFPLLDYIAKEIDWVQCKWKIIPIKMD